MKQSGRTFRMLLKALIYASEGESVVVFVKCIEDAVRLSNKSKRMANSYLPDNFTFINKHGNSLCFKPGGIIRFYTDQEAREKLIQMEYKVLFDN